MRLQQSSSILLTTLNVTGLLFKESKSFKVIRAGVDMAKLFITFALQTALSLPDFYRGEESPGNTGQRTS